MIAERIARRVASYRTMLVQYQPGRPDRCHSCGKSNWIVGRSTAECGSCGDVRMIDRARPADGLGPVVVVRGRHDDCPRPVVRQ